MVQITECAVKTKDDFFSPSSFRAFRLQQVMERMGLNPAFGMKQSFCACVAHYPPPFYMKPLYSQSLPFPHLIALCILRITRLPVA